MNEHSAGSVASWIGKRIDVRLSIEANHPSLPGHFPGEPVVPGVVLLDRLIAAAQAFVNLPLRVTALPQVKFLAPWLPGQEVLAVLEWAQPAAAASGTAQSQFAALRFRVARGEQLIAQGAFDVVIESAH